MGNGDRQQFANAFEAIVNAAMLQNTLHNLCAKDPSTGPFPLVDAARFSAWESAAESTCWSALRPTCAAALKAESNAPLPCTCACTAS